MHGLISYVSEGVLSQLLDIHTVYMGTFDPHGQISCVSEGFLSEKILTHTECIETVVLYALI